jgi:hypothetical protein
MTYDGTMILAVTTATATTVAVFFSPSLEA